MSAPYQVVARWPVPAAPAESVGFDEVEQVIAGLPERIGYTDQLTDNMVRAGFALDAVSAYARRTGTYRNESVGTVVSDLCNDLRHLCDLIGVDWDQDTPDIFRMDNYALQPHPPPVSTTKAG